MEHFGECCVMTHPVAVAADIDDVTVVQESVDERRGHNFVAQDLAPLFEALIGCQHGGRVLVAPVDELEEEHGACLADLQIAVLVARIFL